ncbi:MAG TPA: fibronectin type III domain-containing protein [Geomonas sp.]|nr:fibronectin type III domain-containing protein [Geomonas sp.]
MKSLKVWVSIVAISLFMALALAGCGGGGSGGGTTIITPTAPSAPTGVGATGGSGQVKVNWAPVSGAASYNVYYSTTAGVTKSSPVVPVLGGAATSYTLQNLPSATKYYFAVTAVNSSSLESPLSVEVSATTNASGPADLQATPADTAVGLSWTAVANATGYTVYRGLAADAITAVPYATTTSGTTTYNDNNPANVVNGTTYFYKVTATVGGVESSPSYIVSAIPSTSPAPANPIGVTATGLSTSQIRVLWDAVPNAVSYNVYRASLPGVNISTATKTSVTAPTVSYLDPNPNNSTFYYVVTAVDANNHESAVSHEVVGLPALFTDTMVSGKTIVYTESGGTDTLTVGCSNGGSATYSGKLNGTNTSGTGTWDTIGGNLNLTLPNGTTATFVWDVVSLSDVTNIAVTFTNFASGGTQEVGFVSIH